MFGGLQPQIILLREGTDTSQGIPQLISNINACEAVGETVKSTLGPRGMDKLIFDGRRTICSNDGATIMKELDIVHPAAKALVDISLSQDAEVGDGTTSVVLLAVAFLKAAKPYIEDGVPPQTIIHAFRQAALLGVARLKELVISGADPAEKRAMLIKCAGTAMNSKLIARNKGYFAPMVVACVEKLDKHRDLSLVGIKKIPGGALNDSIMVGPQYPF
jgi:T-complex protein 1 subunit eta